MGRAITDIVTNKNDVNVIVPYKGELVQKNDPIYLEPSEAGLFGAQFYAPSKWVFGLRIPTLWANTLVLWIMSLILGLALKQEVFPRLMRIIPSRGH